MCGKNEMEQLRQWLQESRHTVFLGGAGVSTGSGIPDFRSAYGLYRERQQGISYEEMLSHTYFAEHTEKFYEFLRRVMLYPEAKPNAAHYALAKLEKQGKLDAVITQNIDGLHQAAGSKSVIELHGSENRYYCLSCGKKYDMSIVLNGSGIPKCSCGGTVRPDVVLYEEPLDQRNMQRAVEYVENAELLLVGGTSLVVYPAAGLINYLSRGAKLVLLNRDPTPFDNRADLVFREDIGEVLQRAAKPGAES